MGRIRQYALTTAVLTLLVLPAGAEELPASRAPTSASFECGKSKLTGKDFLAMLHNVAMHGDMRDISFIEEELHVRFKSYYRVSGGKKDIYWKIYTTESLSGTPISILMNVWDDNDVRNLTKVSVGMTFIDNGFLMNCLHITPLEFENNFGGLFSKFSSVGDSGGGAEKKLDVATKEGSVVVGYILMNPGDAYISYPAIGQTKPVMKPLRLLNSGE